VTALSCANAVPALTASLPKRVREFTQELKRDFPHRIAQRSKAFKRRVLALVAVNLPPYPKPTGRPRQPHITEAANMYAAQLREVKDGARKEVNCKRQANTIRTSQAAWSLASRS
jgi:hypothetical protein